MSTIRNRIPRLLLGISVGAIILTVQGCSSSANSSPAAAAKSGAFVAPSEKSKRSKAPTIALTVSASTVAAGGSITLSWSAVKATRCIASHGWSGTRSVSGSETISNLQQDATFGLTCSGKKGSASQAVAVVVQQAQTTVGVVYRRDDSIAYGPGHEPTSGLGGAEVTLLDSSAVSDASGAYTLKTVGAARGNNYTALGAKAAGHASTFYPWTTADSARPLPVALYEEKPATPRPGFILGMIPHDVGGFVPKVYAADLFAPTFDRIRNVTGANVVTLVDTIWVNQIDVASGVVLLGGSPQGGQLMSPDRAMYQALVPQARSRGLQVQIMITLYPDVSYHEAYFSAFGKLRPGDTAFWDAWFAAYRPLVVERANIARELGVEHLSFAMQPYMAPVKYWQGLIEAVRATGYTGKISYFTGVYMAGGSSNFDTRRSILGQDDVVAFMRLWDYIGLQVYDGVKKATPDEVLGPEQPRARIRDSIRWLLDSISYAPVPVLLMIGTPSVHGGVSSSEYIEPCLVCGSLAPQRQIDLQQQADMYQAVCEAIDATPVGNGRVMGLFSWGYHFRDDFSYLLFPGDSAYDKSGNIRGKPAEAVVKHWFSRWSN